MLVGRKLAAVSLALSRRRDRTGRAEGQRALGVPRILATTYRDLGFGQGAVSLPRWRDRVAAVRDAVRGHAAGINRLLGENRITDPECRGAAWLRPITEIDVYRHMYALGVAFGQGAAAGIVPAESPSPSTVDTEGDHDLGSNAITQLPARCSTDRLRPGSPRILAAHLEIAWLRERADEAALITVS